MKRKQPTQQLLGLMRPDPGKPSKWRGPRKTAYMVWRDEQRYLRKKKRLMDSYERLGRDP